MQKTLRAEPFSAKHILMTGATGYLGAIVVASLLRDTAAQITCLTRSMHDRKALLEPIIEEWEAQSHGCWSDAVEERIHQMTLPEDLSDVANLAPQLEGVDEIIHCAGCLDYYDIEKLQAVNVGYTAHLLVLARRLALKRFVYVSTAYSCGYQTHITAEALLPEPPADPTQYTRTKREAERLVAASGVPFVVMRPSILIGTSDTGRYSGKRYGVYQQWMGLERLVCDRYHAEFHTVAPEEPVNLLHQDSFCQGFKAAYHWLPNGAFMNLVSNPRTAPSMRDVWDMWFDVTRPQTLYYYKSFDDIPLKAIPPRQRAYLTFAQVNLEIASHHWDFETTWLELLREKGLVFADATVASVRSCQDRFVRSSDLITKYHAKFAAEMSSSPRIVQVAATAASEEAELANA